MSGQLQSLQSKTCSHIVFPSVRGTTAFPASSSTFSFFFFFFLYSSTALSSWHANKSLVKPKKLQVVDEDICRYGALNLRITDYNIVKLQMTSCFSKSLISSLACFRGVWRARAATHTIVPPIAPTCCWQDQRAMLTHTDLIHSCCWSDSVRRRLLIPHTNTKQQRSLCFIAWHLTPL